MKKILILAFVSIYFLPILQAQSISIEGHLDYRNPVAFVYFNYTVGEKRLSDTALLENSRFKLLLKVDEVIDANMVVVFKPVSGEKSVRREVKLIFLEPGNIKIEVKDSIRYAKITGSQSQIAFDAFYELQKSYIARQVKISNEVFELMKQGNVSEARIAGKGFNLIDIEKKEKVYLSYLQSNPVSPIAFYVLKSYAGYAFEAKKIEPYFVKLPKAVQNSLSGLVFREKIETAKKTGIGVSAMPFTQNDTSGKPVSLASFKGKYLFIDFWASWCAPCRQENPNVVKAFNKYKDKNFTILGISLDLPGNYQSWLDAIHADGLTWTHVSDLKSKKNQVAKLYDITNIPQNFLIDPQGIIIARNLRGEDLQNKLSEVLDH
jgi:peroxiredoxin